MSGIARPTAHTVVQASSEASSCPSSSRRFVATHPQDRAGRDVTVDGAVDQFLDHLANDLGREDATIRDYRSIHKKWGSPAIGRKRVRDVEDEDIDRLFGKMRRAGLSASRLQAARNLHGPFFRWARRRRMVQRSPMAEFELPTSTYVSSEQTPPDAEQLSLYLATALEVVPDIVPVLTLAAGTGMRRGEVVPIRRSRLNVKRGGVIRVDAAIDGARVKATKTRVVRDVAVDEDTMEMLLRHCDRMDERAQAFGVEVDRDAFVFSHEPDCSAPMSPQYVTRQVAVLNEHLGIAVKRPETIALEDEALRLYRQPQAAPRPAGRRGPRPGGPVLRGHRPAARSDGPLGEVGRRVRHSSGGGGGPRCCRVLRRVDPGPSATVLGPIRQREDE